MSEATGRKSSQRLKRRSEEEQRDSPGTNYSSSDESPKGRKLRKLPSREDLHRSPTSPQSHHTSTPRLKALGDRLTVSLFEKTTKEDEPHSSYDSLINDQEKKIKARSLLGFAESRRKSSECMFKCPTCQKQFKYLSNLKSHLKVVHKSLYGEAKVPLTPSNSQPAGKEHQCEVCLKMFKYACNLRTHRKVHSSRN